MTADQEKDRDRLRRHIARVGLVPAMNNTKWRAAVAALAAVHGYRLRFRVRCVRDPESQEPSWETSFPWHIPSLVNIEWLEVDPILLETRGALVPPSRTDFAPTIKLALDSAHVPFCEVGGAIRISGYTRPAS
jgi:hypothetical protein